MTLVGADSRLRILNSFVEFQARKGYPPTIREVATMTNLSKTCVFHHRNVLLERGDLRSAPRLLRRTYAPSAGLWTYEVVRINGKSKRVMVWKP